MWTSKASVAGVFNDFPGRPAWYRGPGWQGARPQWCSGLYALPSVTPCGLMPSSCHIEQWCSQSRCPQWCNCIIFWGSGAQSNLFSLRSGKRHSSALFKTVLGCGGHDNSLGMWTQRNLKLSTCSTTALLMWLVGPPFPVVHNQLLCLVDVEGDIVDLLPVGRLIVVGDQAYRRRVVCGHQSMWAEFSSWKSRSPLTPHSSPLLTSMSSTKYRSVH